MPLTVDTSRMSVEQLRALSAEKQQERTGKRKEEKEWSRHAMALEDTLMQDSDSHGLRRDGILSSVLMSKQKCVSSWLNWSITKLRAKCG